MVVYVWFGCPFEAFTIRGGGRVEVVAVPRTRSTPGGRPVVVAVRLSNSEAADLDARRGHLDRSAFLRWLLLRARKEGLTVPGWEVIEVPALLTED